MNPSEDLIYIDAEQSPFDQERNVRISLLIGRGLKGGFWKVWVSAGFATAFDVGVKTDGVTYQRKLRARDLRLQLNLRPRFDNLCSILASPIVFLFDKISLDIQNQADAYCTAI
jgi:hypothetical protein